MTRTRLPAYVIAICALVSVVESASPVIVLRDARIVTSLANGELSVLPRGSVVIQDGKIGAVGESLPAPDGAIVVDLEGKWLLPGFIDAHAIVGLVEGDSNEYSRAITEDFRILDAVDPYGDELPRLLRAGVTTIAAAPGNQNVVGGKIACIKVLPGRYPLRQIDGPTVWKASIGTTVLDVRRARAPTSFSGAVAMLRDWGAKSHEPIASDLDGVTFRESRVLVHVQTRTQVEVARRLFADSGLVAVPRFVALPGERRERLRGSPAAVVGPYRMSMPAALLGGAAELERLDVPVTFASDGSRNDLVTTAMLAIRNGLTRKGAVAALTLNAARVHGIEGHLGRIAPGLDADLVAWSGDPLSLTARVERAWIDGVEVNLTKEGRR